jgi:hypothetical protein
VSAFGGRGSVFLCLLSHPSHQCSVSPLASTCVHFCCAAELVAAEQEEDDAASEVEAEYLRGMLADAYQALDEAAGDSDNEDWGPGHMCVQPGWGAATCVWGQLHVSGSVFCVGMNEAGKSCPEMWRVNCVCCVNT